MFALKNFAFFGHMDGWEYQGIMAVCSFMCDALCSVFPKTSNQAWSWTVPFWRIFNWKVKTSRRPGDKSCCLCPHPRPPLCLSLSMYTYVRVLHPTHSSVIPFLRPRASKCRSGSSQAAHSSAGWISHSNLQVCLLGGMMCGGGAPDTHLLMDLLTFHRCCALLAVWHVCVSVCRQTKISLKGSICL